MWRILILTTGAATWFFSSGCARQLEPALVPATPIVHQVFQTPMTGRSDRRPAVQVDVLDASENWIFTAELYLAVQSSRFPAETWVLLPINVGDFAGCKSRFVQLPFEVAPEDVLLFNVLDDDVLTAEDERHILAGCRLTGYCVLWGGAVYAPPLERIVTAAGPEIVDLLGEVVVSNLRLEKFDNYGNCEFIVPDQLPDQPNKANRLTLLNDSNYAHVQLRIYGPKMELDRPLAQQKSNLSGI